MLCQPSDLEDIITICDSGSDDDRPEVLEVNNTPKSNEDIYDVDSLLPDDVIRVKKEPDVIDKTPPVVDETSDHQTILNILLHKSEELELKHKPSGIRENKMFTLDMRKISIVSAGADGAYFSKGSAKKHYTYTEHGSQTAHKNEDGTWYVNEKVSKEYRRRVVPESQVYELT
ncbi:Hypothetical predicted protein [Paramuricea clavata]|uniref:Uncharacterized protein n=1 Tax=Paramuricea clavata TaxID=317549 RepID=A0A7D9E5H1_PARCT|nr:Hypothetical predicted protein [Paramuricea clavata]